MSYINCQIRNNIAEITLKRNEKRNALNSDIIKEGIKIFKNIELNNTIKILIFKAIGDTFCAGLDLKELNILQTKSDKENYDHAKYFQDFLNIISKLNILTIAKVEGNCFGGGIGILSVSDIVISKPNLILALPEIDRGMPPMIITPFLIKKMGLQNFKKFLFKSGNSIKSNEGYKLNLIDYVLDNDDFDIKFTEILDNINNSKKINSLIEIKKIINQIYNLEFNSNINNQDILNLTIDKHLQYRKKMDFKI